MSLVANIKVSEEASRDAATAQRSTSNRRSP